MQQPVFRAVLWAVVEAFDRDSEDVPTSAFVEAQAAHPDLTRPRFDEIVDVLVRSDHLRCWAGPTDASGTRLGPGSLMPTAKARLQFDAAMR